MYWFLYEIGLRHERVNDENHPSFPRKYHLLICELPRKKGQFFLFSKSEFCDIPNYI